MARLGVNPPQDRSFGDCVQTVGSQKLPRSPGEGGSERGRRAGEGSAEPVASYRAPSAPDFAGYRVYGAAEFVSDIAWHVLRPPFGSRLPVTSVNGHGRRLTGDEKRGMRERLLGASQGSHQLRVERCSAVAHPRPRTALATARSARCPCRGRRASGPSCSSMPAVLGAVHVRRSVPGTGTFQDLVPSLRRPSRQTRLSSEYRA